MNHTPKIKDLKARKHSTPIVCLTAYDDQMATLIDPHVDLMLVGDSVGTVVHGFDSTRQVTLKMMIKHGQQVMQKARHSMVVIDMPHKTYNTPEAALLNARTLLHHTRADAVKLEGGKDKAPIIKHLTTQGIAVMGHIGMLPQTAKNYKAVGGIKAEQAALVQDAKAVQNAGAFAMVVECVYENAARRITRHTTIPTIGIGASPLCDGQILVTHDLLGITGRTPRFVTPYEQLREIDMGMPYFEHRTRNAIAAWANDVRCGEFPTYLNCYGVNEKLGIIAARHGMYAETTR